MMVTNTPRFTVRYIYSTGGFWIYDNLHRCYATSACFAAEGLASEIAGKFNALHDDAQNARRLEAQYAQLLKVDNAAKRIWHVLCVDEDAEVYEVDYALAQLGRALGKSPSEIQDFVFGQSEYEDDER